MEVKVVRNANGWRRQDSKGRFHSAEIPLKDKARAERQADALNAKLAKVRRAFSK